MSACPECNFLGYPCPPHDRGDCTCPDSDVIARDCDEHGHLLDIAEVAA